MTKFVAELADTREAEKLRRTRPTKGMSPGERKVFWRLLAACGDENAVDVEEHCRQVARVVVAARARGIL